MTVLLLATANDIGPAAGAFILGILAIALGIIAIRQSGGRR